MILKPWGTCTRVAKRLSQPPLQPRKHLLLRILQGLPFLWIVWVASNCEPVPSGLVHFMFDLRKYLSLLLCLRMTCLHLALCLKAYSDIIYAPRKARGNDETLDVIRNDL